MPYPNPKTYHRGDKINQHGGVSALCFAKPRAIDLRRALWTNRDEAVTCPKCRLILATKIAEPEPAGDAAG